MQTRCLPLAKSPGLDLIQTGLGLSLRQTRETWAVRVTDEGFLAWMSYRLGGLCLRELQLANRRPGSWSSGLKFIQTPLWVGKGSWTGLKTDERRLDLEELQDTWAVRLTDRRPGWNRFSLGEEMQEMSASPPGCLR